MPSPDHFRNQSRLLRIATLFVFIGLALLLLLGFIGLPWLRVQSPPGASGANAILLTLVQSAPALGYLWALWAVQRALGGLAAGMLFHPTVAKAMRQIGFGVLTGALINVFAVTSLARLILDGRSSYLYFDLSGIVLGVVGAAMVLLARVVDQARMVQAELDEIV